MNLTKPAAKILIREFLIYGLVITAICVGFFIAWQESSYTSIFYIKVFTWPVIVGYFLLFRSPYKICLYNSGLSLRKAIGLVLAVDFAVLLVLIILTKIVYGILY